MTVLRFKSVAILIFLAFTVACGNDKGEDQIKVSVSAVNVRENLECKVEISGGTGDYSCEMDDNEIATAKVAGRTLIIIGHSTGTTNVTVRDGVNNPPFVRTRFYLGRNMMTVLPSKIKT